MERTTYPDARDADHADHAGRHGQARGATTSFPGVNIAWELVLRLTFTQEIYGK